MTNLQKRIGEIMPEVRSDMFGESLYLGGKNQKDFHDLDPKQLARYHDMVRKIEEVACVPVGETIKALENAVPGIKLGLSSVEGYWHENVFLKGFIPDKGEMQECHCIQISGGGLNRPIEMVSRNAKVNEKDKNAAFIFAQECRAHCAEDNPSASPQNNSWDLSHVMIQVLFTPFSNPVNWTTDKEQGWGWTEKIAALESAMMAPVEQNYEKVHGPLQPKKKCRQIQQQLEGEDAVASPQKGFLASLAGRAKTFLSPKGKEDE